MGSLPISCLAQHLWQQVLRKQLHRMRCPQDHRYLFDARRLPKLLEEILLIATRIRHCVTPCYLVCKHSCLLAYRSLIYIRIVPGDRVT
ncbi:hypothetical protein HBI70_180000 [Parastagonospora nodorum]|nr:hypothetical protein HBI70_180000 [Parastagonospora nodorum]